MRQWFPFTDYDFYAYLASGGLVLALLDYLYADLTYLGRSDWSFVQIVLVIIAAYILGHLVAMLSSIIFEQLLARTILTAPVSIQLGFKKANWLERVVGRAVGRYYSAFPVKQQSLLRSEAAKRADCPVDEVQDAELVFQIAFAKAGTQSNTIHRLDGFRNQYGFCRNLSLVGLVSTMVFTISAFNNPAQFCIALLLFAATIGMTVRFLKFYAAFASETLRSLLSP